MSYIISSSGTMYQLYSYNLRMFHQHISLELIIFQQPNILIPQCRANEISAMFVLFFIHEIFILLRLVTSATIVNIIINFIMLKFTSFVLAIQISFSVSRVLSSLQIHVAS